MSSLQGSHWAPKSHAKEPKDQSTEQEADIFAHISSTDTNTGDMSPSRASGSSCPLLHHPSLLPLSKRPLQLQLRALSRLQLPLSRALHHLSSPKAPWPSQRKLSGSCSQKPTWLQQRPGRAWRRSWGHVAVKVLRRLLNSRVRTT
jgi:hypothetical protein